MQLRYAIHFTLLSLVTSSLAAPPSSLSTVAVGVQHMPSTYIADGVVEAVRQARLAAQVAGAIVALPVKTGDQVQAGQLLVRIDARAAGQNAAASQAQLAVARASLNVAEKEFARQKQLFLQQFISQAALDQAEAALKASKAQVDALQAQSGFSHTQVSFHQLTAPFAGTLAEIPVTMGDMAMPGQVLMTLYDPRTLRVGLSIPPAIAEHLANRQPISIEIPAVNGAAARQVANKVTVLPSTDVQTHTRRIWLDLPSSTGLTPGLFARVSLPIQTRTSPTLTVPSGSVIRRAELTAVYVLNLKQQPLLRQVKLGQPIGDFVTVLSGLTAGERVVLDPLAAARVR